MCFVFMVQRPFPFLINGIRRDNPPPLLLDAPKQGGVIAKGGVFVATNTIDVSASCMSDLEQQIVFPLQKKATLVITRSETMGGVYVRKYRILEYFREMPLLAIDLNLVMIIPWTGKSNDNRKFALTFLFLGGESSPSDMLQGMFAPCSSACAGPL